MTPIAWFAVALMTGDGDPIGGQVVVDGQPCEAAHCLLEPGRHVIEGADGRSSAFFLPEGAASVRVTPATDASRYGVALRRFSEPEPMPELPSPGPGGMVPYGYTVPAELPSVIRVARHADNNCNNPVERIDEVPLASYVAGVVHGEIGIFRSAGSGDGVQIERSQRDARVKASFETFAVAARSYAVWWVLRRGLEADYHIHDGPCNQVYQDARDPVSEAAAQSTAGQILVAAADHSDLDKHEYASACARHGTLPSGRNAHNVRRQDIVPDDGLQRVCVGRWCGHDSYNMAHQDNPFVERANNRCLVRGICQWGSLERAVRGDTYTQIIAHYQPDLVIRDGEAPAGIGGLQGSVRDGNGDPIPTAQLLLERGDEERFADVDAAGEFQLEDLQAGVWTALVHAPGYDVLEERVTVVAGVVSWRHFALSGEGMPPMDAGPAPDASVHDAGSQDTGSQDTGSQDAGAAANDAGSGSTSGSDGGASAPPGACNCGTGSPFDAIIWLAPLLALRRKKELK